MSLYLDFNVQIMSRRGTPQVLAFVAVGVVFVYGFYSYNELKSALRRSDESIKRTKLETDNLSTQLLGLSDVVVMVTGHLSKGSLVQSRQWSVQNSYAT